MHAVRVLNGTIEFCKERPIVVVFESSMTNFALTPLLHYWGMCAKQWETSYDELLQLFSLPSLQDRRLYLDLCTMFKIVHGLFHFPPGIFVEQPPRVTRSQSYQLYVPPYTHTSSFYNSYIPRTIHNWNMFISHAPSPSYSVSSFKCNFWTYMQD